MDLGPLPGGRPNHRRNSVANGNCVRQDQAGDGLSNPTLFLAEHDNGHQRTRLRISKLPGVRVVPPRADSPHHSSYERREASHAPGSQRGRGRGHSMDPVQRPSLLVGSATMPEHTPPDAGVPVQVPPRSTPPLWGPMRSYDPGTMPLPGVGRG
jgi:hypothetical protein